MKYYVQIRCAHSRLKRVKYCVNIVYETAKKHFEITTFLNFELGISRAGNSNSKAHCAKSNEEVKHMLNEEWFLRKIFVTEKKINHASSNSWVSTLNFFFVKSKMKNKYVAVVYIFGTAATVESGRKKLISFLRVLVSRLKFYVFVIWQKRRDLNHLL